METSGSNWPVFALAFAPFSPCTLLPSTHLVDCPESLQLIPLIAIQWQVTAAAAAATAAAAAAVWDCSGGVASALLTVSAKVTVATAAAASLLGVAAPC